MADYWSDRVVFGHVAHLEVASATYEVAADFTKSLPQAFTLTVTLRTAGLDVGSTAVPLQNGPVQVPVAIPGAGSVQGRIDDWRAIDASGKTIDTTADPAWSAAAAVAFTVTAMGNVTIPVTAILAKVPHLGWALDIALTLFGGGKVQVNLGHTPVVLPIHRDHAGKPLPNPV